MSRNRDRYLRIKHKDYEVIKTERILLIMENWVPVMIHGTYDGMWHGLFKKPKGMM